MSRSSRQNLKPSPFKPVGVGASSEPGSSSSPPSRAAASSSSSASASSASASPSPISSPGGDPKAQGQELEKRKETWRETAESLAVAVIFALVIRGFLIEPFVIPTGSMAPTLRGRHKEIVCAQCGHNYAVNASLDRGEGDPGPADPRVNSSVCVNCRFSQDISSSYAFNGDRILALKFPYLMPWLPGSSKPERYDVVLFKFPERPDEDNYIKRLIGLPGETIRIHLGDIYTRANDKAPFRIAPKPLHHIQATKILVYDDARRAKALDGSLWRRWRPEPSSAAANSWTEPKPSVFACKGSEETRGEWSELRYRHLAPEPEHWEAILNNQPLPYEPRPTLITDFSSFNTERDDHKYTPAPWLQPHWVGDLTLSAKLVVKSNSGLVRLELVRAGVAYRCDIDAATGQGALWAGEQAIGEQAPTGVKGPGEYRVELVNVDGRLNLVVDGRQPFGEGASYPQLEHDPTPEPPNECDLAPAAIAVRGADVEVSELTIHRDLYYTQTPGDRCDYEDIWSELSTARSLFDFLASPAKFQKPIRQAPYSDYLIRDGHYLMLGDNSPRSSDSRAWSSNDQIDGDSNPTGWNAVERQRWEVPESLMIGKAFFVYWPHAVPVWPRLSLGRLIVPFYPDFSRMSLIR